MNIPYLRLKGQEPKTNLATVVIWTSDKTVERICSNEIGQNIGSTAIRQLSVIWPPWSLMSTVQIHLFLLSIASVIVQYQRPIYKNILSYCFVAYKRFPVSLLGYSNEVNLEHDLYKYLDVINITFWEFVNSLLNTSHFGLYSRLTNKYKSWDNFPPT